MVTEVQKSDQAVPESRRARGHNYLSGKELNCREIDAEATAGVYGKNIDDSAASCQSQHNARQRRPWRSSVPDGRYRHSSFFLHCANCGASISLDEATGEAGPCPKCGFDGVRTAADCARRFHEANDRKDRNRENLRFVRMAAWAGLIEYPVAKEALHKTREDLAQFGGLADRVHRELGKNAAMTPESVAAVLVHMYDIKPENKDEEAFARAAIKSHISLGADVEAAQEIQRRELEKYGEARWLGMILVEKGQAGEGDVRKLYREIQSAGRGPLAAIHRTHREFHESAAAREAMLSVMVRKARRFRFGRATKVKGIVAVTLFCLGFVAVYLLSDHIDHEHVNAANPFWLVCPNCTHTRLSWPKYKMGRSRCPICGSKFFSFGRVCNDCGTVYPFDYAHPHSGCPKCGSLRARPYQGPEVEKRRPDSLEDLEKYKQYL